MSMAEDTNPRLVPLEMPRRRPVSLVRQWKAWGAALLTIGGALMMLQQWGILSAPWESKAEATKAHTELRDAIEVGREEHRQTDLKVIEAINALGDKLERRRK